LSSFFALSSMRFRGTFTCYFMTHRILYFFEWLIAVFLLVLILLAGVHFVSAAVGGPDSSVIVAGQNTADYTWGNINYADSQYAWWREDGATESDCYHDMGDPYNNCDTEYILHATSTGYTILSIAATVSDTIDGPPAFYCLVGDVLTPFLVVPKFVPSDGSGESSITSYQQFHCAGSVLFGILEKNNMDNIYNFGQMIIAINVNFIVWLLPIALVNKYLIKK